MNEYYISEKDLKQLLNQLKNSAKKRGIKFNLTTSDIDDIGIPITCPVLGIPLKFHRGRPQDDSISFDRIDSTKGYTKENLVIVCYRVNKLKSNATLKEMQSIVRFYNDLNL
jgi:hypothetical protein